MIYLSLIMSALHDFMYFKKMFLPRLDSRIMLFGGLDACQHELPPPSVPRLRSHSLRTTCSHIFCRSAWCSHNSSSMRPRLPEYISHHTHSLICTHTALRLPEPASTNRNPPSHLAEPLPLLRLSKCPLRLSRRRPGRSPKRLQSHLS